MSARKTLCSLVAATIMGLSGCGKEPIQEEEVLTGKPIATEAALTGSSVWLSVVVQSESGKYVLCNATSSYDGAIWGYKRIHEGKTIIQSEIDDEDDGLISLRGRYNYNRDRFEFTSVSANGYTIDAKRK